MSSTFKERLLEGMRIRGYRQADLSERTGLSKSRLSHYINGRYEAKQDALYLIAKALNVSEAWLMGHDVPMNRSDQTDLQREVKTIETVQYQYGKEAVQLLSYFIELNEKGRKKAIDSLEAIAEQNKYRKDGEK